MSMSHTDANHFVRGVNRALASLRVYSDLRYRRDVAVVLVGNGEIIVAPVNTMHVIDNIVTYYTVSKKDLPNYEPRVIDIYSELLDSIKNSDPNDPRLGMNRGLRRRNYQEALEEKIRWAELRSRK